MRLSIVSPPPLCSPGVHSNILLPSVTKTPHLLGTSCRREDRGDQYQGTVWPCPQPLPLTVSTQIHCVREMEFGHLIFMMYEKTGCFTHCVCICKETFPIGRHLRDMHSTSMYVCPSGAPANTYSRGWCIPVQTCHLANAMQELIFNGCVLHTF